jgi:hypothetical protein
MPKTFAMPAGMRGWAEFSREEPPLRRHALARYWGRDPDSWDVCKIKPGYLLMIGLNPSKAGAYQNDQTILKVCTFAKAWGFDTLVMMNLSDIIATKPEALLRFKPEELSTEHNIGRTISFARHAGRVVCCWGVLHPDIEPLADRIVAMLREEERELYAIMRNADGSPQHPLYIPGHQKMIRYHHREDA